MEKDKKNKYFLFLIIFFAFFLLSAGLVHALEITYPSIPGYTAPSPKCTGPTCLPIYVAYIFGILIYVAGILAAVSFAVGAASLIASVDNTEAQSNARDRMKSAALGLALTLASFIIIQTINPKLITPTLTALPGQPGVFFVDNTGQKYAASPAVSDVPGVILGQKTANGKNITGLLYDCTGNGSGGSGPGILVWEYQEPGLEEGNDLSSDVKVARLTCGKTESISNLGSLEWMYDAPGVYFCQGGCGGNNMCSGYMTTAATNSQDSTLLAGKIGGVRIVNDQASNTYYGVILHKEAGLQNGGDCNLPITSPTDYSCQTVADPASTSAADIFQINQNPGSSGDGVTFYSEPFGPDTGSYAGFFKVPANQITSSPFLKEDFSQQNTMCFDYTNINVPDEYKYKCTGSTCGDDENGNGSDGCSDDLATCASDSGDSDSCQADNCTYNNPACVDDGGCDSLDQDSCSSYGHCSWGKIKDCSNSACETFQDKSCSGSIKIKGSYLVALYSKTGTGQNSNWYCQTFTQDVDDLYAQPFIASGSAKLDSIYIVPIRQ